MLGTIAIRPVGIERNTTQIKMKMLTAAKPYLCRLILGNVVSATVQENRIPCNVYYESFWQIGIVQDFSDPLFQSPNFCRACFTGANDQVSTCMIRGRKNVATWPLAT